MTAEPEGDNVIEYRGKSIDADKNIEGEWVAIVDGTERGRGQRSRADAIRAGRAFVNRSLGKIEGKKKVEALEESPSVTKFWDDMRKDLRGS